MTIKVGSKVKLFILTPVFRVCAYLQHRAFPYIQHSQRPRISQSITLKMGNTKCNPNQSAMPLNLISHENFVDMWICTTCSMVYKHFFIWQMQALMEYYNGIIGIINHLFSTAKILSRENTNTDTDTGCGNGECVCLCLRGGVGWGVGVIMCIRYLQSRMSFILSL